MRADGRAELGGLAVGASPSNALHVHGVGTVSKVEAAALGTSVGGAETEGSVGTLGLGHAIVVVLLVVREVLFDDVVCLHVDLLVGVILAVVDLLHAAALLDEQGVAVDGVGALTSSLLVEIADLQDVLQAIQRHLDDLVFGAGEQVAEGLDAALRDEVADLLRLLKTSRSGVADGPAGLLARLQVAIGQEVD